MSRLVPGRGFKHSHMPYYLYRKHKDHKWKVSEAPPSGALLHSLASSDRKAAQVRRAQLNASIQRKREEGVKIRKKLGTSNNPHGRPKSGNAKVRVVLTVPPDVAEAIPGNKNEYGNKALREKLEKDGLIERKESKD